MPTNQLRHEFVDHIPDAPKDGILYVSIEFRTTAHLCCCGCGNLVVLPLRPTAWRVTYDGDTITMAPSVGNWSFPCRSHYLIRNNRVVLATNWTPEQIEAGRRRTLAERGACELARENDEAGTRRHRIRRLFNHLLHKTTP